MKKLTLILCFLFCFLIKGKSQAYTPFSDSTSYWQVLTESCGGCYYGPGMACICGKWNYFIQGDTTIGLFTYKKVFNFYQSYNPWTGYTNQSVYFVGGIRNDIPNKKVYFASSNGDTLLYDFNLNVGDTLPQSYVYYKELGPYGYVTIDSIDSININGNTHKRYHLNGAGYGPGSIDYLIEGIGSTFGLLELIQAYFEDIQTLECFKYDINVDYYGLSGCNIVTNINEQPTNKLELNIYPNPIISNSILSIDKGSGKTKTVIIYNAIGETIKQIITCNNSINLYRNEFSPGLYFITVSDDLGQRKSIKTVVN